MEEIARIAKDIEGTVGVSARHLETGRTVDLNPNASFPMASAFKLPIAVWVLSRVDQNQLALDQMVEVRSTDLCPGSGIIRSLLYHPGVVLSVRNLLELMLVISDNTATDVLLRLSGGPDAVNSYLRREQFTGVRVDRFTRQMVADKFGVRGLLDGNDGSIECFNQVYDQLSEVEKQAAAEQFAADERDTMTPAGMVDLLSAVAGNQILSPASGDILLGTMLRCQTGEGAIKGMLPPGTAVAHKTGTLAEVVANDAGIITLPGEAGRIAISISIQSKVAIADPSSTCQRTIAHLARAVYDYFLFTG